MKSLAQPTPISMAEGPGKVPWNEAFVEAGLQHLQGFVLQPAAHSRTIGSSPLEACVFPSPPQDRVARRMLQCMPDRAVELVRQGAFPGADLVQVASDAHRPSFKEGRNVTR